MAETVFGIMEKIGGFKETVFSVIGLLVVFVQERLFKGAFLKQLYQRKTSQKKKAQRLNAMNDIEAI